MTLEPFFSLSPVNSSAYPYNPAQPEAPHAQALLYGFGIFTSAHSPKSLDAQHNNNELILGYDPVDPTDQSINSINKDLHRRSCLLFYITVYNVTPANQYLLLISIRPRSGAPTAQIFVESELVHSEAISSKETIAILLDAPGHGITSRVYLRLASSLFHSQLGFLGMDCYLL